MNTLFKAEFVFSKQVPKIVEKVISYQFVRLREFACDALNPNYEKWNAEFKTAKINENDELVDFGGTEYCKYICEKSRDVLKQVNIAHPSEIIYLDVDEVGDIIAKTKNDDLTVKLILMPYEEP